MMFLEMRYLLSRCTGSVVGISVHLHSSVLKYSEAHFIIFSSFLFQLSLQKLPQNTIPKEFLQSQIFHCLCAKRIAKHKISIIIHRNVIQWHNSFPPDYKYKLSVYWAKYNSSCKHQQQSYFCSLCRTAKNNCDLFHIYCENKQFGINEMGKQDCVIAISM